MLTAADTQMETPTPPVLGSPPAPDQPVPDAEDVTFEEATQAAEAARALVVKDGKIDMAALFAAQAIEATADRLNPGGVVDEAMLAAVPVLFPGDVPADDAPIATPHHARITRLAQKLDAIVDLHQPPDAKARDIAIEQELPNVRKTIRPTEQVSELQVRAMAARAVDLREAERRRTAAREDADALAAELEAVDREWHRTFTARRDIPVSTPELSADELRDLGNGSALLGATERLTAASVLEQRKTQALLGELLAVQTVPDTTPLTDLLDILTDETASPYARKRADNLFARKAAQVKPGTLPEIKAHRALVDRYMASREARVPEPVRRAEQAELRTLMLLEQQAKRVRVLLSSWTKAGIDPSRSVFDKARVEADRAARQQAIREANTHWRPIATTAAITAHRKARAGRL